MKHPSAADPERTVAFQQLVRRTGVEDIKSLAAMIVQSERFGTSLGQALKVYADALRTRRRLRAEAAVGKAGIKMLFPIVIFILPVLFVITWSPACSAAWDFSPALPGSFRRPGGPLPHGRGSATAQKC